MFDGQRDTLSLWNACRFVDPAFTKTFKKAGGFSGRSTNATYVIMRATQEFGPLGIGWGWDILDSYYADGAPMIGDDGTNYGPERIHVVKARVWYIRDGVRSEGVTHFGQTTFVGMQKKAVYENGIKIADKTVPVSDEEHAKKSLTDAITKALSCLGFSAEIHLGMWDDNKYVAAMQAEARERASGSIGSADSAEPPDAYVPPMEKEIMQCKRQIAEANTYADIKAAVERGRKLAAKSNDTALHDEFGRLGNTRVDQIRNARHGVAQ